MWRRLSEKKMLMQRYNGNIYSLFLPRRIVLIDIYMKMCSWDIHRVGESPLWALLDNNPNTGNTRAHTRADVNRWNRNEFIEKRNRYG